jgi:hypothetical protein
MQVIASEEVSGQIFASIYGIPTQVTCPTHPKHLLYTTLAHYKEETQPAL